MQLKNPKITMLVGAEGTTIRIKDSVSATDFIEIKLTPEQLSAALSRIAFTSCEVTLTNLDRIGKKHHHKEFVFETIPGLRYNQNNKALIERCHQALGEADYADWTPDTSFSSQNSFFEKDQKCYARTTIRKWANINTDADD